VNRSYIGDLSYHGEWYAGTHTPIIDHATFKRVQVLLGEKKYNAHESVYGGQMVKCAICGSPMVVEIKTKQTKQGEREYRYYRCAHYTCKGHPRKRFTEAKFDAVMLEMFRTLKVKDENVHKWIIKVLQAKTRSRQKVDVERLNNLKRQLSKLQQQRDRLLNLRVMDEIDKDTYAKKDTELRDRYSEVTEMLEGFDRQKSENSDIALKVFELSQQLEDKWVSADIPEKRQLLDILCLNLTANDVSLYPTIRKPFDALAEGLTFNNGRGERI
jgi:hypothetical protein